MRNLATSLCILLVTLCAHGEDPVAKSDPATHWAYQPIVAPAAPAVARMDWPQSPIDRFILQRLESAGLVPSPAADRRTLIRRVYFDLIGLPPAYEEVRAFEADPSPDAFEKVVDRLLDSPLHGQRWGRHWLDVARYADTMGYNFTSDPRFPFAWTYRDYVIDALNEDKPYDRFVQEQIAADWLDSTDPASLAAMGLLNVGRRFDFDIHATTDDRIDVVTRGFLAMTVQCARCHDHKYDAITQADYYALYGVFRSSTEPAVADLPVIGQPSGAALERFNAELAQRQREVEQTLDELQKSIHEDARKRASEYLAAALGVGSPMGLRPSLVQRFKTEWEKLGGPSTPNPEQVKAITDAVTMLTREDARAMNTPEERNKIVAAENKVMAWHVESPDAPARAMVMYDAPTMFAPYIFKRGNAGSPGDMVPRRFLSALATSVGGEPFKEGSGRLGLAQAITHPANPLTARVFVNRIWQWHFGQGLVRTPSDFGVRGQPPTHPELLDHLARIFIDSGYSIKKLHREILLSATYRQSSATSQPADPENRLLGHFNRHRLEFEPMRDAMLQVAGRLDAHLGGRGASLVEPPYTTRRSIYGYLDRQQLDRTLRTFDFASPDASEPQRPQTTVPQQALFLMNSTFVTDQLNALLNRQDVVTVEEVPAKVRRLYQLLYSRDPSEEESALALKFLTYEHEHHTEGQLPPWLKYAQALMVSNEFMFVD